jgi:hypothetical protein
VYFTPCDASAQPGDPTIIGYPPHTPGSCAYFVTCADGHQQTYEVSFEEGTVPCISPASTDIEVCDPDGGAD